MSDIKQKAKSLLLSDGELAYVMFVLDAARERMGHKDIRVELLAGHMWDAYIGITIDLSPLELKLLRRKTIQEAAELLEDLLDLEGK